jgi:hypothetical protein
MEIPIPAPTTLIEITWFLIGITFARGFGKKFDLTIKATAWYKSLSPIPKWLIESLLNSTHHFWIGLLLMIYITRPEIYWLGAGIAVDDIPDIPRRFQGYFKNLTDLVQ